MVNKNLYLGVAKLAIDIANGQVQRKIISSLAQL